MAAIAIDGPAGAGKSTIAKLVSKRLGFIYVDTGAMYRAMALFMLERGTDINDQKAVAEEAQHAQISIRHENGEQAVILNGENVNGRIRTQQVSDAASTVSTVGEVRERLVALQRELAASTDVVMDGRDIGTVVLPDAKLKIFMTASSEVRAHRRYLELVEKGMEAEEEQIRREIEERDERDRTRAISPLRQAEDAVLLDTSDLSIDEVAERILELWK
ncbi:MAG: (d)CMP kinase [Lachnospiraceae bacterium]|jgi:cytidylate kinase|nr:(d)CMP kinase [Lachnospiraceae bacterium]